MAIVNQRGRAWERALVELAVDGGDFVARGVGARGHDFHDARVAEVEGDGILGGVPTRQHAAR